MNYFVPSISRKMCTEAELFVEELRRRIRIDDVVYEGDYVELQFFSVSEKQADNIIVVTDDLRDMYDLTLVGQTYDEGVLTLTFR
jgi:hypothetical protein